MTQNAIILDSRNDQRPPRQLWSPLMITGAEIEQQLLALEDGEADVRGRREMYLVHPQAPAGVRGLAPATQVALHVAWVAGEVLVRAELRGVDEDAHGHDVVLGAGHFHQRHMPRVQVAHRGHEAKPLPRWKGGAEGSEVGYGVNGVHVSSCQSMPIGRSFFAALMALITFRRYDCLLDLYASVSPDTVTSFNAYVGLSTRTKNKSAIIGTAQLIS